MMGCWNKAIITGGEGDKWKLWSPAYHLAYKPLLENLKKANLKKNQDYFIFCYDWRKSIEHNKQKLESFIQTTFPSGEKVNLIGHSMGGLIGRSYAQSTPEKVNKLITIGSPHKGTPQAYFAWEGGVIIDKNKLSKFLKELIIWLNKFFNPFEAWTIRTKIPSIKDLLPTYDFLVDKDNPSNIKPITDHIHQNEYFMNLNSSLNGVKEKMATIYGAGLDTLEKIKVIALYPHVNWFHEPAKIWEDGEPFSQIIDKDKRDYTPSFILGDGDETVTVSSANIEGVDSYEIPGDHLEIIKNEEGILRIFNLLDLEFPNESVSTPVIEKILALILHSPANFWLTNNNGQQVGFKIENNLIPNSFYDEEAKTIVLLNPEDNFTLTVLGEDGIESEIPYEISFLELNGAEEIIGYRFADTINPGEKKHFPLDLAKQHLFINPDNQQAIFSSLINKINQTKSLLDTWKDLNPSKKRLIKNVLKRAINRAQKYKHYYDNKKYRKAALNLNLVQRHFFASRRLINKFGKDDPSGIKINEHIYSAFSELNYLYLDVREKQGFQPSSWRLKLKLEITEKALNYKNKKMQRLKDLDKKIYQYQTIAFLKAEENHTKAKSSFSEGKNLKAFLYSSLGWQFLHEL